MSQTLALLNAVIQRLQERFGRELAVELFPENPKNYRLNHSIGAVLVAFGSSKFGGSKALDAVLQERNLVLPLTLIFRDLHGAKGAVAHLDSIREELTGWTPPNCDESIAPIDEVFNGQIAGVWQYTQRYATRATHLQRTGHEEGLPLLNIDFEEVP